jgi:hypothetical protein
VFRLSISESEGRIDREGLQKAIDSVPRRQTVVWPSGPFLTSVAQVEALPPFGVYRPPPPVRPAGRTSADVVALDGPLAIEPNLPACRKIEASEGVVAPPPEAQRVSGVSVQLDIAVERRRFFWWHLALSMVVRRLGH